MIFNDVYQYLESVFPRTDSEPWDCDGLDICINPNSHIQKIVVALDVTSSVIQYAKNEDANLIITHHPFLFDKINVIDGSEATGKKVVSLIKNGISAISYHTRLDRHEGGVNDTLCERLKLKKEYSICDGLVNICSAKETEFDSFVKSAKEILGDNISSFQNNDNFRKIAVCGGGGKSLLGQLPNEEVDTYLTGEVDHMALINAAEYKINLILGTHYRTEALVLPFLKRIIEEKFPDVPVLIKYEEKL